MDDFTELQVPLAGFEDVAPIPQEDGPDPVVSIAYKHNCECVPAVNFQCSTFGVSRAAIRESVEMGRVDRRAVFRTIRDSRVPLPFPFP